ncbi:MAG: DsbE family thiol:disulfide interchange protein [Gammaproteobacteria bacterium]|nr:DsbE family thiol:disulfide interchange protein [Gammaproteobacteria bacterium]
MLRYFMPLVVIIVLLVFFYKGLGNDPGVLPSQYIGKPAPVFELPSLKDASRTVSNADLKGQVSLVNIWATWCTGCRAEHGFLMQLAEQGDIPIYAINWRDRRDSALSFLSQLGDPYVASGFDEDGRVGIDWGVYGAPETFLIDPDGQVVYRFTGPLSDAAWQREFVPRIEELRQ